MSKGNVIVFTAPSGAGKTTVKKRILEDFPDFTFSVSATTRKKRETEIDGADYFFISEEEFEQKIKNNDFIEWEKFYDYYYGTLKSFVTEKTSEGKTIVLDIDVKGALSIKKIFPDSLIIYILPPSLEVLKSRLLQRKTETEIDLQKRIDRAEMELSYKNKFDCIVVNEDIEETIKKVKEIINKFLSKED